jgi:hypothetical protein
MEKERRKKHMSRWESNAIFAQKEYGVYVDWEERFYSCPFCDEPIYEEDWEEDELSKFICPICEDCDRD